MEMVTWARMGVLAEAITHSGLTPAPPSDRRSANEGAWYRICWARWGERGKFAEESVEDGTEMSIRWYTVFEPFNDLPPCRSALRAGVDVTVAFSKNELHIYGFKCFAFSGYFIITYIFIYGSSQPHACSTARAHGPGARCRDALDTVELHKTETWDAACHLPAASTNYLNYMEH